MLTLLNTVTVITIMQTVFKSAQPCCERFNACEIDLNVLISENEVAFVSCYPHVRSHGDKTFVPAKGVCMFTCKYSSERYRYALIQDYYFLNFFLGTNIIVAVKASGILSQEQNYVPAHH